MIQRPSMSFRLIEADGIDARPPETVEEIGRGFDRPNAARVSVLALRRPAAGGGVGARVGATSSSPRRRRATGSASSGASPTKIRRPSQPGRAPGRGPAAPLRRSRPTLPRSKDSHPRRLPRTPSLPARAARCRRSRHPELDGGYGGAGRTGSGAADPLAVPLFEASRLTLAGPSSSCFAVTRPTDDATVHKRGRADTGVLPPPFTLPSRPPARCSRRRRCCRRRGRARR